MGICMCRREEGRGGGKAVGIWNKGGKEWESQEEVEEVMQ